MLPPRVIELLIIFLVATSVHLFLLHFVRAYSIQQNIGGLPIIKDPNLKVEVVTQGLDHPTQMAFLGMNDFLVLEKNNGIVLRVVNDSALPKPMIDVNVANKQERGLLGVAILRNHNVRDYQIKEPNTNSTKILLFYTESEKDGNDICHIISYCERGSEPKGNRLYVYNLEENSLVNPKLLLDLPAKPGADHMGGVIKIGPDNNIYLTGGDGDSCAGRQLCQQGNFEGSLLKSQTSNIRDGMPATGRGGILRITQDGQAENGGILGGNNPLNKYYAYGIRNSFGIDFDPISGKLWDTENGPGFGDEINLVEPGFNSGWLKVQGMWPVSDYNPSPRLGGYLINDPLNENVKFNPHDLVDFNGRGSYSKPEFVWNKTIGPTALLFFNSDKLGKKYENDLFVGDIGGGRIFHFELNKDRTELDLSGRLEDRIANNVNETKEIVFGKGFGGITDLDIGPDGYLYVLSYSLGTVYRIVPLTN